MTNKEYIYWSEIKDTFIQLTLQDKKEYLKWLGQQGITIKIDDPYIEDWRQIFFE